MNSQNLFRCVKPFATVWLHKVQGYSKLCVRNIRLPSCDVRCFPRKQNNLTTSMRCDNWKSQNVQMLQYCGFHTSARRNIPPLLWIILNPVSKIAAALGGRGVRKWYKGLQPHEKKIVWTRIKQKWPLWVGLLAVLTGSAAFYYQSHIQTTPFTGRERFVALTHEQISQVAEQEARMLNETYRDKLFSPNSIQTQRVIQVVKLLMDANPELRRMQFENWTVYVVDDPLVNACVLPNGQVYVFDGMLKLATTQDELAIVLGHEMAHALLEHGVEELSYGQLIDYLIIVCMAALWLIIPSDGIAFVTQWFHNKVIRILTHMPHSRTIEQEADKVGAMLAAKACFDVRAGIALWKNMENLQKLNSQENNMLPEWASTHPDNLKRAQHFDFMIPQAEKWRDEMKCPLWPAKDPRDVVEKLSKLVDNHMVARQAGQDLRKVTLSK